MQPSTTQPPVIGILDPPPELLAPLLEALAGRGLRCGLIQLADEDFDPDVPGKDSYELRRAGVQQLLLAAERKSALLREYLHHSPSLPDCLAQLALAELDLVLVAQPPADWLPPGSLLRVHHDGAPPPALPPYLATLSTGQADISAPQLPLDDPAAVADFLYTTVFGTEFGDSPP